MEQGALRNAQRSSQRDESQACARVTFQAILVQRLIHKCRRRSQYGSRSAAAPDRARGSEIGLLAVVPISLFFSAGPNSAGCLSQIKTKRLYSRLN
jgi:hypothetical protein